MANRIRITSETYDFSHDPDVAYMDLPDGWDSMSKADRDEYLNSLALEALAMRAGAGACVVDENDEEVEGA